jgi:hypothetical protein
MFIICRQHVQVSHQEEALVGILQLDPVLQGADQVSQVAGTGGAVPGQDAESLFFQFYLQWYSLKTNSVRLRGDERRVRGATPFMRLA